jgi:hypothetical protein
VITGHSGKWVAQCPIVFVNETVYKFYLFII